MQSQERSRQNLIAIFLLIAAITVILLFASGLSTLKLRPGGSLNIFAALTEIMTPAEVETSSTSEFPSSVNDLPITRAMRIVFWALLFMALIYAFISPQFRNQLIRMTIFVAVLIFAMNRLREAMTTEAPDDTATGMLEPVPLTAAGATLPDPPAVVTSTPEWIIWTINILVALLVVALIWFLWRKFRPQPEEGRAQVQVAQQAEAALSELEQGGDLRDIILRCYAQMSAVLHEDSKVYRHSAMTARDFEDHLSQLGFEDVHISRLTRLFEAARYSSGTPGPEAEEEAIACLTAIVQDYSRENATLRHQVARGQHGPDGKEIALQP